MTNMNRRNFLKSMVGTGGAVILGTANASECSDMSFSKTNGVGIEYFRLSVEGSPINENSLLKPGDIVDLEARVQINQPKSRIELGDDGTGGMSNLYLVSPIIFGNNSDTLKRINLCDSTRKNGVYTFYGSHEIPGEWEPEGVYNKVKYGLIATRGSPLISFGRKSSDIKERNFRVANGLWIDDIIAYREGDIVKINVKTGARGLDHLAGGTEFSTKTNIIYFEKSGKEQETLTRGKIKTDKISEGKTYKEIKYQIPVSRLELSENIKSPGAYIGIASEILNSNKQYDRLEKDFNIK